MRFSSAVRILFFLGAALTVLAVVPYSAFDLSRFFAPKELVLNAVALALALLTLRQAEKLRFTRADIALSLYLFFSLASALFAKDLWLSSSAVAVTFSGAAVFWAARVVASGGLRGAIIAAAACAGVIGAVASLAQAYGVSCDLFSVHRIPGGTMGNRNFMAHLSAICTPALVLAALTARRKWTFAFWAVGAAIIADALVLSRCRAALLGLALGGGVLACAIWFARGRWRDALTAFRLKVLFGFACAGIIAALLIPNTLDWKSDSPYLDTVSGIVNYHSGSGHGRLIQYGRTLRMAAAHPLLGVGPGNWGLVYPEFSRYFDPSIDYFTGMTINPWPSSDWMAIVSERGFPAVFSLIAFLLLLLFSACRRALNAENFTEYREGVALAASILVSATAGCFDPVLMLPASSFALWSLFGALSPAMAECFSYSLLPNRRRFLIGLAAVFGALAIVRSAGQVAAMAVYSKARNIRQISTAARLDPGNLKIRIRLSGVKRQAD